MEENGRQTALTPEQQQTAIQKAEPLAFELTTINQAYRVANHLSKSALIPTPLRGKPDDILVVLMSGRELGLMPMQSLRHLHVIEGRIAMSAQMMLARVQRSGECEYFTMKSLDDEHATFATRRHGSPNEEELTFTMKDAVAMNLANRDNWKKQPRTMLRWRSISALCRMVYPDIVEGIYTEDEANDFSAPTRVIPDLVQQVAPASEASGAIKEEDLVRPEPKAEEPQPAAQPNAAGKKRNPFGS